MATTSLPIHSGLTLAILDPSADGSSLVARAHQVGTVNRSHWAAEFYDEADLRYTLRAMFYHLNRIVDQYTQTCHLFDEIHPQLRPERTGSVSNQTIGFEVDAFLGVSRRVYEAIRKVVWKYFKPESETVGSRWRSFEKMLPALATSALDPGFILELQHSWSTFGIKLKAYRDCLSHADGLDNDGHICWLTQYDGRWKMTYKLPANPEAKSHLKFDFENGPDALTYCWELAAHLVNLAEHLVGQDRVRTALDASEP